MPPDKPRRGFVVEWVLTSDPEVDANSSRHVKTMLLLILLALDDSFHAISNFHSRNGELYFSTLRDIILAFNLWVIH